MKPPETFRGGAGLVVLEDLDVQASAWSLAGGRRAVESNAVTAARGWTPLEPQKVALVPARFPS